MRNRGLSAFPLSCLRPHHTQALLHPGGEPPGRAPQAESGTWDWGCFGVFGWDSKTCCCGLGVHLRVSENGRLGISAPYGFGCWAVFLGGRPGSQARHVVQLSKGLFCSKAQGG